MRRLPTGCMTRLAVTATCKGLAIGAVSRYQAAVARVMAVRAVGNMRRGIDKCIRMTRGTVISESCSYKTAVIRCCSMD